MNQLDSLTRINLEDLITSFGLQTQSVGARLLSRVFLGPAREFAGHMVGFDGDIGQVGLPEASRRLQRRYVKDVRVHNPERLPPGPILVLSNHPGMTDTTSLFSALGRPDLKIVALPRPFLLAMPNMAGQLLYVMEESAERMKVVREVSAHLRECGAVLTFPAGKIEPDPDVLPGAVDSLAEWTPSVGLFVRNAPETAIVPVLVRSVVWKGAARSPLLWLKRGAREKEKLAAALQLLAMIALRMRPVTVHVQIGRPVYSALPAPHPLRPSSTACPPGGPPPPSQAMWESERNEPAALRLRSPKGMLSAREIHQAVVEEMRVLIENPPSDEGVSALNGATAEGARSARGSEDEARWLNEIASSAFDRRENAANQNAPRNDRRGGFKTRPTGARLLRSLPYLLVIVLLYFSVRGVPFADIWAALRGLQLWQVGLLLLINAFVIVFVTMRWWLVARVSTPRLSLPRFVTYRLAVLATSYFTPGPQVGGEPVQVILLRRHGATLPRAISVVIIDKLMELLGNFIFMGLGLLAFIRLGLFPASDVPASIVLAALLAWPPLHLLLLYFRKHPLRWVMRRTLKRFEKKKWFRLIAISEQLAGTFTQRHPFVLLGSLGVSLLAMAGMALEYVLMLSFLGMHLSLGEAMAALTASLVAFLLPLPGGLGALEASQVLVLGALGYPAASAISLALIMRMRDLFNGGLGLVFAARLFSGKKRQPRLIESAIINR